MFRWLKDEHGNIPSLFWKMRIRRTIVGLAFYLCLFVPFCIYVLVKCMGSNWQLWLTLLALSLLLGMVIGISLIIELKLYRKALKREQEEARTVNHQGKTIENK